VKRLLIAALLVGAVSALIPPNTSRDFYYYVAAGRDASAGVNVYTTHLTDAAVAGLPLERGIYRGTTMPYGPAWVWIARSLPPTAWAYKLLMFVAWAAILLLLWRELHSMRVLVLMAFWPFVPLEALVNGHNDIVMMALLTGWLVRPEQPWWLGLSVLVKYATGPLFLVAVIASRWRAAIVAVCVALVLGWYWQDGALIASARVRESWEMLTPVALAHRLPFGVVLGWIWRLALVATVGVYGWRYWQDRTRESMTAWVTVILGSLILGSPYALPWYWLWIVPSLLLSKDETLWRLALPFFVLMPFVDLVRNYDVSSGRLTLALYGGVALWWIVRAGSARTARV
jgi:hypothetical protein